MAGCVPCGRGFHRECLRKRGCDKCHPKQKVHTNELNQENKPDQPKSRKSAKENLKDPKSTGRKRAAELYPIEVNAPCEWRGKRNCGGGRRPIIGCLDGLQQHRHHGPVKDTTRNESGNVHRICTACHVHWHELNDLEYNEKDYNLLPHQPTEATEVDIVQNILDWKSGKMGKDFVLASSKNKEKHAASSAVYAPHSD